MSLGVGKVQVNLNCVHGNAYRIISPMCPLRIVDIRQTGRLPAEDNRKGTQEADMAKSTSRRTFVKTTVAAAASGITASLLEVPDMMANPFDLPIGLQLYTVGKEMDADPAGTLKAIAATGYKQVE